MKKWGVGSQLLRNSRVLESCKGLDDGLHMSIVADEVIGLTGLSIKGWLLTIDTGKIAR